MQDWSKKDLRTVSKSSGVMVNILATVPRYVVNHDSDVSVKGLLDEINF